MVFDKTKNKETGNEGENVAALFLIKKQYKIIDRNIVLDFGEIDILAEYKKTIVIVEVKTVKGNGFGEAIDLVRHAKQKKLRLLAKAMEQQFPGKTIRIDVIGVNMAANPPIVTHLESAVEG